VFSTSACKIDFIQPKRIWAGPSLESSKHLIYLMFIFRANRCGQRRRDGCNNPATRCVGQSLQRDERALDRICPRSDIGTTVAPFAQNASVRSIARNGSTGGTGPSSDDAWERTKGTDWPASTANSPMVLRSSPQSATGVRKTIGVVTFQPQRYWLRSLKPEQSQE
jgi:hypothetical protein